MGINDMIADIQAGKEDVYRPLHMRWVASGAKYTKSAVKRVMEVMERDWLTEHRSDGGGRIRPSLIGGCARKQRLSYEGASQLPPSPSSHAFMSNGTFGHYRWQLAGLSAGWLVDIEVPVKTDYGLEGSADGLGFDGAVFELKTTGMRNFSKVKLNGVPLPTELQATGYMDALGATEASIFYEGRDYLDVVEHRITLDPEKLQLLKDVCEMVTDTDTEIPPLPECISESGNTYNQCGFRNMCRPGDFA